MDSAKPIWLIDAAKEAQTTPSTLVEYGVVNGLLLQSYQSGWTVSDVLEAVSDVEVHFRHLDEVDGLEPPYRLEPGPVTINNMLGITTSDGSAFVRDVVDPRLDLALRLSEPRWIEYANIWIARSDWSDFITSDGGRGLPALHARSNTAVLAAPEPDAGAPTSPLMTVTEAARVLRMRRERARRLLDRLDLLVDVDGCVRVHRDALNVALGNLGAHTSRPKAARKRRSRATQGVYVLADLD